MTQGTNAVIDCILSRSAPKYYDPSATLNYNQIQELVKIATTAPTFFHLQNWRFIAVRTRETKARLSSIAWNQAASTDAAVTFILCGPLADTNLITERLAPVVAAGMMSKTIVSEWEISARGLYMANPQTQRDEAIRSATFGAGTMMRLDH